MSISEELANNLPSRIHVTRTFPEDLDDSDLDLDDLDLDDLDLDDLPWLGTVAKKRELWSSLGQSQARVYALIADSGAALLQRFITCNIVK